jgi:hypothetical protein
MKENMQESNKNKSPFPDRPDAHFGALFNAFMLDNQNRKFTQRTRLDLNREGGRYCLFLSAGVVSVRRKKDNLVIANSCSVSVLGLAELFSPLDMTYIYFESPAEGFLVHESQIINRMKEKELLFHVIHIQSYIIQAYCSRDDLFVGRTSYEIIRSHLLMLMNEPEDIRNAIAASNYILQRTLLSRTTVMRILQDLRHGKYIVLSWGRLHDIIQLPLNY